MNGRTKSATCLKRLLAAACCMCLWAGAAPTALSADVGEELARGFASPPGSARPHTWWHWMNGNITKEGITADLEAMQRVGIGGAQVFNVLEGIPDGPVAYLSPRWKELFRHAVSEADRLGLELCFTNCAGWSSSGGPWIKPEQAMQTVVTSETKVKGPAAFDAKLPQPPTNLHYYRDIAVLAFPTPARDVRLKNLDAKALRGFESQYGLMPDATPPPAAAIVPIEQIVDLSAKLDRRGKLTWDVPAGNWTVLRVGRTPTGKENHPAPQPGRGLECDKLSAEALDAHWAAGVEPVLKYLGPLAGKSLNNSLIDSYEVGDNNWSPKFREEFIRRRSYDPIPFLPALTGRYVEGGERTERFLWDFRRTIGDLFAENYFGHFVDLCHRSGIQASAEPYDGPFECLQVGSRLDIVMGEFWVGSGVATSASVKLAASIAHTHGIRVVGAESFTAQPDNNGKWLAHPGSLKIQGDAMWCDGLNRFIFHTYAHQPWLDKAPGMTMGQWGTHIGRTNTWWEQSRAWMKYIARAQYLLQHGRAVADVLYFAGESSPNGGVMSPTLKGRGYEYDAVGSDLIMALTVEDGRVRTPCGGSYRLLVLPDTDWMTPQLAKKIGELVAAGAIVLSPKPKRSPSLSGYPACDAEVAATADKVWGKSPGEHALGRGKIIADRSVEEVLAAEAIKPDFKVQSGKARLGFAHRRGDGVDLYFVANQKRLPESVDCSFRVAGCRPELWDAETGTIRPAPAWRVENGRTIVRLDLEQAGSVFVVFRQPAAPPADPIVAVASSTQTAPRRIPRLTIHKAVYGDFSRAGGGKVDVTARLAELVEAGELEVTASNSLAGDPAQGIVKELRVDYSLDGAAKTIAVAENQGLRLPADGAISEPPALPAPRLTLEHGELYLTAAEADRYTLTTASGAKKTVVLDPPRPIVQSGPWEVSFPAGRGAPDKAVFDKLISWPERAEPGIKYFSGTAAYRKTIEVPAERLGENFRAVLDLGQVREIAEVRLNGRDLGILWKSPFRVDITEAAKPGANELEVRVTNLWPNRLIGDEQHPDDCQWDGIHLKDWPQWMKRGEPRPTKERIAFTTWKHWTKDSPLQPSGLLGPVKLLTVQRAPVK
jgi:hypothetical protein